MGTETSDRLLSLAEAAHRLHLSHSTLYKYVESKMIPHKRLGNRVRFDPAELTAWVESHSHPEETK